MKVIMYPPARASSSFMLVLNLPLSNVELSIVQDSKFWVKLKKFE